MKGRAGVGNDVLPEIRPLLDTPLFISLVIFSLILAIAWQYIYDYHIDSFFYNALAKGEAVKKPFSGRIFYPTIAHLLQRLSGLSLDHAFVLANSIGLLMLLLTVTAIIKSITSYAVIAIPLLFTPFLIRSLSLVFLPDLFSAGLTGLFFYLLYRSYFWPSLSILLLIYLARENAIFLCLSLAAMGLCKYRLRWAVAGIAVLLMGIVITSWAGRHGLPQEYQMNFLLYLALKLPKNLLYNLSGILIWTNVYPDVGHPYFLITLPGWLPLGKLHTIGITPMQPLVTLNTIMLLLTTFGVAPSLLGLELAKHWKQIFAEDQFWLQVAIIYGVSSFLVGIAVSYDVIRLLGYAFPAFWLALPALLLRYSTFSLSSLAKLLCYQVVACWLPWILGIPWFVDKVAMDSPIPFLVAIFGSMILHFLAVRTVNHRRQESLNFA
ncbi:MAG: hypothetical protein WC600_04400 [Desulfobaccales bacterium]